MLVPIIIPTQKLNRADLEQFKNNPFENVIKFVVDINQEVIALCGEMHADAEKILIENGSSQEDLWGANLWPWAEEIKLEYISLINIRPHLNNFGMEIENEGIQARVKAIVFKWILL
jgi:hypothetical protein